MTSEVALKKIQQALRQTIDTQIQQEDPKETKQAMKRLQALGYLEQDCYELLGKVVVRFVWQAVSGEQAYDHQQYISALAKLPAPYSTKSVQPTEKHK